MSDTTIATTGTTATLSIRAQVIEAAYEYADRVGLARRTSRDATVVPADTAPLAWYILGAAHSGVLSDAAEARRIIEVMTSILEGGDTELAAERITNAELCKAWTDITSSPSPDRHPDEWRHTPPRTFADEPTLRRVRVETSAARALPTRAALEAAFTALAVHTGRTDPAEYGPQAWRAHFEVLCSQIAATLRYRSSTNPLLAVGEIARAERIFAALVHMQYICADDSEAWKAVIDPDFYAVWHAERTAAFGNLPTQRYAAMVAELARVCAMPFEERALVHNYMFTDAPGLTPLRYLNDDATYPLIGTPQRMQAAVTELVVRAGKGPRPHETWDGFRYAVQEMAEPILFTARDRGRGGLSLTDVLRLERLVASAVALEPATLPRHPGIVWTAITDQRAYDLWLEDRNTAELIRQREAAGLNGPVFHRWHDPFDHHSPAAPRAEYHDAIDENDLDEQHPTPAEEAELWRQDDSSAAAWDDYADGLVEALIRDPSRQRVRATLEQTCPTANAELTTVLAKLAQRANHLQSAAENTGTATGFAAGIAAVVAVKPARDTPRQLNTPPSTGPQPSPPSAPPDLSPLM
ncbi:hypothetical protein [Nocardia sp. XZ_19_369]|uniref:hypothetical protein n=1 Tax=Nocardia sp. XZ_19_369 TaxID=2769487 RepID=UPI00188ED886|nr:hypothetical protein [Nocardia sp. XZ_19_369]